MQANYEHLLHFVSSRKPLRLWARAKAFVHLQVQHVYTVLQSTGGGTRRAAMADLRQTYESTLKFSGKV